MVTRSDSFPKPIRLMERSNAGNTMELSFSGRSSPPPSGVRLFEELSVISSLDYSFNVLMSDSESFTFMRALITRF